MGATTETPGSREEHTAAGWAARAAPVVAVGALVAGAIATGTIGGGGDRIERASAGNEACLPAEAPAVMGQPTLTAGDLEAWWWAEHGTMELDIDDPDGEPLGIGRVAAYYIGNQSGVRGDVAFAQAVLESDWFTDERSAAGNYNFGGVPDHDAPDGATPADPEYYASYATPAQGVQAHLDHLHLYAEGEAQADTWDEVGDHWTTDRDGHDYWHGDGRVGDLQGEMTVHAEAMAAQREAELDTSDDGDEHGNEEDSDDETDETDETDDRTEHADDERDESDDRTEHADDERDDCDNRNDPCQATAAELLGYTEPTLADDFTGFDPERWELTGAEAPTGTGTDGDENEDEDEDAAPVEIENEVLTLTTRVDDPGALSIASALGQEHGLWEVRSRLPLDAERYHSWISLRIDPSGTRTDGSNADEPDAEETDDGNGDPVELVLMDNAADEPTGRLVTADVPGAAADDVPDVTLDDNRWHNWAVEWTPDAVRLYLDGELWYETPEGTDLPEGGAHLVIGTESVAPPGSDDEADEVTRSEDTTGDYRFGIDRVRVFELRDRDDECDRPDDEEPPPTTEAPPEEETTTTVAETPDTTAAPGTTVAPSTTSTSTTSTSTSTSSTTSTTVPDDDRPSSTSNDSRRTADASGSDRSDDAVRTPSAASTQVSGRPRLTG